MADFSWLNDFSTDPNMLQYMGNMGQKLQAGQGWAAAMNPSDTIRNIQFQKALGGKKGDGKTSYFNNLLNPTPVGQPGPDSVTIKRTADGTTVTSQLPSAENLSTYGTTVPPEAVPATQVPSVPQPVMPQAGGVSDQRPFWGALLGIQ